MTDRDTIVAISTPPGRGGIGIVRLSGPRARPIAEPMLRLRNPLEPNRARFGELLDLNPEPIEAETTEPAEPPPLDQTVVTFFAAPHSYTGEDVIEIALHGSPVLLDHALRQALAAGARLAEPGEFTQRAFLAGRVDLTQAEAVHDLIASSTLEQARLAARQLGGSLAHAIAPIKQSLITLIASLEAGIDFAEDDIDVMPSHEILHTLTRTLTPLRALEQSFARGRILREGLRLAIVGRPNAGKSSLFNRLLERERAIVTASPGTTRDTVSERVAIRGIPVELIDTAGLREATDEAERLGIARTRHAIAEADLTLLVIDASAPPAPEDQAIITEHLTTNRPLLIALNKSDLLPAKYLSFRPERSAAEKPAFVPATEPIPPTPAGCPIHHEVMGGAEESQSPDAEPPADPMSAVEKMCHFDRSAKREAEKPAFVAASEPAGCPIHHEVMGGVEERLSPDAEPPADPMSAVEKMCHFDRSAKREAEKPAFVAASEPPGCPIHHEVMGGVEELLSFRPERSAAGKPHLLPTPNSQLTTPLTIPTSATTGHGLEPLREAIVQTAGASPSPEPTTLTTLRQHTAVQAALAGLESACAAIAAELPHEVLLLDLYEALRGLDALTGATTTDDILHLVFSTFCIGK